MTEPNNDISVQYDNITAYLISNIPEIKQKCPK